MLNSLYNNSLNLLLASDEEIKGKVVQLIESMPKEFREDIANGRKDSEVVSNGALWSFIATEEDLSIAVVDAKRQNKDYMSLYLRNLDDAKIKNMYKVNDYEHVGFVTFFMTPEGRLKRQVQLSYDCYLERKNNEYYVRLKCKINSLSKETKELISKHGYTELAESVFNKNVVKVNINDILSVNAVRK